MKNLRIRNKKSGFTLVEVLVVVIIVAILAAISVPLYLKYVEDARAAEARTAISAIWTGAKIYHQRTGKWESDWEKFKVDIDQATIENWDFRIMGNPPKQILGISTSNMPGGAGHRVTYDTETGQFTGYGSD
jgi:prepilin-type N-terminal cleavage/methylation domain-containing protein